MLNAPADGRVSRCPAISTPYPHRIYLDMVHDLSIYGGLLDL